MLLLRLSWVLLLHTSLQCRSVNLQISCVEVVSPHNSSFTWVSLELPILVGTYLLLSHLIVQQYFDLTSCQWIRPNWSTQIFLGSINVLVTHCSSLDSINLLISPVSQVFLGSINVLVTHCSSLDSINLLISPVGEVFASAPYRLHIQILWSMATSMC